MLKSVREGLDPLIYDQQMDYLHFIKYMRNLYGKNKIQKVSSQKQLEQVRLKHKHHIVVGAF